MAQVTTLQPTGTPGAIYSFTAKASALATPPDMPGMEFATTDDRLHYRVYGDRMHYATSGERLHYKAQEPT